MKAIIIGAGRGSRLRHLTDEIPKTLVPVLGRPMLDGILEALAAGGFARSDVVFICGYRAEVIKAAYPDLTYVENRDWEHNNILLSLLCAREHLSGGFVSTYADIVYRPQIVADLMRSPHDLTLACDTDWRRRYEGRSEHPETDAEKLRAEGERVVEISRRIPSAQATGEFIGVMKASARGASALVEAFDEARAQYAGQVFREGRPFERAYLLDMLQHLVEKGAPIHKVDTHGGYMEIDTLQDASLAETWWRGGERGAP
ncbi:phosphocholine cytidylyltransferase family protein [Chondromyces apiculatus]|uniref:Putative sugar nucleotidyltransferase n=1 Tax=Chondromyces apiculatus DSM 436 TaxID=1192034 RepID=A0A017SY27_9BACT|nr:phosphocholine cytidylyltransferase family protein [Chondromyces apiculatus]EYF01196.1 Putative sugar nucleotidyltransferase [Chondromyces apiculatus DSM 436]